MHDPVTIFAIIGILGVGAQWLAWRLQLPAIVLMLVAGICAGPLLGILHPKTDFGAFLSPMISIAVALILFEGGLTLNFRELRDASKGLKRLIFLGAPISWLFYTLAIPWFLALSWPVAAVFGGILVITGPTVVTPLLRQIKLEPRVSALLHWEAIVNDPIGALIAVLMFEIAAIGLHGAGSVAHLIGGIALASLIGFLIGQFLIHAFRRGWAAEYLKAPILFAMVLAVYALCEQVLHESGLLAVTVMGATLGNARLSSLHDMHRFKENIAILLVSGVFVILAATLDAQMIALLDWRAFVLIAVLIIIARPLAIWISLAGAGLSNSERFFIGWLAPRGVVAVAMGGFFGERLLSAGYSDAALLAPVAFAISATTVALHGFSARWLGAKMGLRSTEPPGVLLVGGSRWSVALAETLTKNNIPVMIADKHWSRLRHAKQTGIPVYYGEILSEAAEHHIDLNLYETLIGATRHSDYNALVCTDFGPEFGRENVFQIGRDTTDEEDPTSLPFSLGGRVLNISGNYPTLEKQVKAGWRFQTTRLSESYDLDAYWGSRQEGTEILGVIRSGRLLLSTGNHPISPKNDDLVLSFMPPAEAHQ